MEEKKTLLERYEIPVGHLDFKYIEECDDAREMEKIFHVLMSGEEGYFPDLTKCAENKLRQLKPQSRLFRYEEQIKGREALEPQEMKPIYEWNEDIKGKDKQLEKLKETADKLDLTLPPVRKFGRITKDQKEEETPQNKSNANVAPKPLKVTSATDYRKWDLYDADEEALRMDLAEERVQEEVERKNRLNALKCKTPPKIEELLENTNKEKEKLIVLTDLEKEKLSEDYRLRGNEYFRAKEWDNAIVEYTKAIQAYPEKAVAPYNNRAVTYFKQQKFSEAIKDCESCLQLEPNNLKGRLRLAESNYAYGKKRESYQLYVNVLEVDPSNAVALKAITELRNMFEDLPPPNSTRLQITDSNQKPEEPKTTNQTNVIAEKTLEKVKSNQSLDKQKSQNKKKSNDAVAPPAAKEQKTKISTPKNYDLADLVKPNRLVKNKILKAAENFGKMATKANNNVNNSEINNNNNNKNNNNNNNNIEKIKTRDEIRHANVSAFMSELRLPCNNPSAENEMRNEQRKRKPLIEEI